MNKIFKIVWSKSRQCYVVVSEYAKNTGGKKAVATALVAFSVLAGSGAVQAAWPEGAQVGQSNFQIGRGAKAGIGSGSPQNSQAIGVDAEAHQSKDVALGSNAVAKGLPISNNKAHPATALGAHSVADGDSTLAVGFGTNASNTKATAVGANASATGTDSTVVGSGASTNQASASVLGSNATVTGVAGTAVGSSSTAANNSFAGGNNAMATGGNSVAIGMTTKASGTGSVAVGNTAQATNNSTTAVGDGAKATGISSSAFGQGANASNSYAIAVGVGAQATNVYTSAFGYNAQATSNNGTAVGANTTAVGQAFAGGNGAQATGNNSVAVGNGAQSSDGSATAVGDGAKATGYQSSAIGNGAKASRSNALAVGTSATATEIYASAFGSGASAAGSYGTAIGTNAKANTGSGTAVGGNANAEGDGSTAIGGANASTAQNVTIAGNTVSLTKSAYAKGQQSLAVGYQTQALGADSVAVGTTAVAGNAGNVAVGHNTISKGLNTVTLGRDLAANGAQSAAIGSSSSASGQFALAIGTGYAGGNPATPSSYGANASGDSSIAIGRSTQATATGATAIGGAQDDSALGAKASGVYATAIGGLSEASGAGALALGSNNNGFGAKATGEKAIAVGAAATASGARSVVVGVNSSATGNDAQAIGNSASVGSNYGTALGTFAKVESGAERGIAIGNSNLSSTATTVKVADGIALGSYSVADRGAGVSGYNMTALRDNSYAGTTTGAFTSGLGALAIGTGQKTRQITGVAAGNADTDAVNVAQLRSVSSRVKAYNENTANGASDYRLANQALVAKSTDKDKLEIQALNTNEGVMLTFTPKTTAVIQNGNSLVTAGAVYTAIDNAKTHYVSVKSTENNNRNNNGANGLNSVAIGGAVGVSGDESIGIGHSITGNSDGERSVLLGSQIMNLNREGVLIGQNLFNKGTNNILIGKGIAANDAYASNNVVLGNGATLSGAQAVLIGKGTGSYGASTVTIGDGTTAGTQAHPSAGAVTIGKGAKSYGASAVTIGDGASVGTVTQAVTNSVAIGKGATATGESSVVIGDHARSSNVGSVAIGYSNSVLADNGVAIGNGTSVTAIDGVAIGNSSMANRAPDVTGYDANDNKTDKYTGLTGRAITSNHGAVSIGGNGFSRQIIGVSAGSADTDAVNVAQLKSVNLGFAGNTGTSDVNLAKSTLGIKGDNTYIKTAAAGRNLTITPNIQNITMNGTTASAGTGLADANNVASAINTAVNSAGWKIKAMGSGLGVRTGDTTETRIGNNDSVLLQAGDNLVINKTGSRFTYSLNPILNNLTKAMFTSGSDVTTIDANSITMTSSGISLTNSGINAGNKVITNVASGGTTATNAANIGDVQNAVANLSQNLTVTDGTNSGTVNLKNQSLKVAGANGITTNMNGQTLTVGLDSTTNNKVNDTATAVGRTISLGGDTGTTTAKSLTTGDVNFGIKSGNGYLTTAANGNDVTLTVNEGAVKDAAVSAVTVSTDAATDNPVTITPTTGTNSKDYKITVDTSKLAQKTNLAYTADNGTGGTTSLSQGLTFKDGTLTTATAGANGTITYDVKKGTLANTGGTVSVTGNDGVATAQNVADMINNATTSVSTLNIADGGTGTGSVNLKNQTLKVTGSNGLTTTASGQAIDVALDATTKNKIDNAADKDLSNLSTTGTQKIKDAAAFKVKANGDAGDDVKGGDEVNFKDGQNIKVSRTGKEFTIATADDVSFNKVTAADSVLVGTGTNLITLDGTTGTVTSNIFKAGNVSVSNSGINAGNKVISNVASGGTTATNAANIGDVQNAVANLSQNLTVTDGTNSGTVNLKNQSLKVAGANGITTNMNGQTLTVGLDSTTNNKVNDTATAVGRTISLGGDTGTTTAKSLTTGDVNFGIKSGNGYLTTAANGNDVTLTVNEGAVKDAAVSAVTVSTDAATDNPVTITPTTGTNSKDYKITVDTSKLAQKTNLAYTADNGTGGTTSLSQGLTFKDGTLTTATAGANGTITYDVKKGTLANTGGTVSVTGNDGVATAQNVADMINNATTSVSTLNIADGGTGTGSVNLKNQTLKVTGSNGLTTTASGQAIDVALDATTKNKIDNAADKDLSNLSTTGTQKIKDAAAFKVKANGDAGDDVKGGDEVNFKDGQNIKVSRTGKEFTIATADDVSFNKVTAADSVLVGTGTNLITLDGTTGTVTGNIFKAGNVNVNGANNTVTGLSNTTWSGTPVSGRAATEDQLKQVADDARAAAGSSKTLVTANSGEGANSTTGNISLTSTTAANGQVTYDVKLADKVTVGTAGNAVTVDGTTGKVTAKDGDFSNKVTVGTGSNKVTVDGADGSVTANTVKAGNVTVNGSNNTITGLSNTTWSGTTTTPDRAATEGQLKQVADAAKSAVDNVTMKYDGDNGGTQTLALKNGTFNVNGDGQFTETTANATGIQVKVKEAAVKDAAVSAVTVSTDTSNPNNPITVTATPGSHSMDYKVTFDGTKAAQSTNLSYKANGGSAETVSLSTGLNFKDGNLTTASVAPNGDVKYDVKTATIAVNNGMAGLNGNDGVATAQNVVDAMNAISHQTAGGLERVVNRIGAVESEGRRVAAQSAALAALKPIQYDPLEPNQIMAGIGNYRGETAAAVGLAHYANEDTMLHMGVALGDNNNMVNVGVTHKFGSAAKKAAIPDRYKAGPISSVYVMQDEVTQLRAENAQQKATLTKQQEEIDALKAAVAQLMAKQ